MIFKGMRDAPTSNWVFALGMLAAVLAVAYFSFGRNWWVFGGCVFGAVAFVHDMLTERVPTPKRNWWGG